MLGLAMACATRSLRIRVGRALPAALLLVLGCVFPSGNNALAEAPKPGDAVTVTLEPEPVEQSLEPGGLADCQSAAAKAIRRRLDEAGFKDVRVEAMPEQGRINAGFVLPEGMPWETAAAILTRQAHLAFHQAASLEEMERALKAAKELPEFGNRLTPYLLKPGGRLDYLRVAAEHIGHVDKVLGEINSALPLGGRMFVRTKHPAPGEPAEYGLYLIDRKPSMAAGEIVRAMAIPSRGNPGRYDIHILFGSNEADQFGDLTEKNIGKPLAIVYNGQVYAVPVVQSRVTKSLLIVDLLEVEAATVAADLRAGDMPCPLKIVAVSQAK